jgi:hypothetical protein
MPTVLRAYPDTPINSIRRRLGDLDSPSSPYPGLVPWWNLLFALLATGAFGVSLYYAVRYYMEFCMFESRPSRDAGLIRAVEHSSDGDMHGII